MEQKENKIEEKENKTEEKEKLILPTGRNVLGICIEKVGGSRMRVKCSDGKTRLCRIPGRLKRKLWVREGDILIVEPWELGGETKGDIIFKYNHLEVEALRAKGYLEFIEKEFF